MSELSLAGHVSVAFEGDREAVGPLTFAQHDTLAWIDDPNDAASAVLNWNFVLPPGTTLDDVSAAFAILLARHESLRTSFTVGDEPTQHVASTGELELQLFDVDSAVDAEAAAFLLVDALRTQGIDFTAGLPFRAAAACTDGVPRAVVAVYSHMIADFGSTTVLGRQFTELVADPTSREPGPRGHQPLDQALFEASAGGRRRSEAALQHWRTHLAQAPQATYALPAPRAFAEGRVTCVLRSFAGAAALQQIASRTKASRNAVVLAATCAVLAARTGERRLVFVSLCGNRLRSRLDGYVGNLAQDSLVSLDIFGNGSSNGDSDGSSGFDGLVGRAVQATFSANIHGSIDPRKLQDVLDQVSHERGIEFARDFVINDLSVHLDRVPDGMRAPEGQSQETSVTWQPAGDIPETFLCAPVRVDDELVLTFTVDTERVAKTDTEAFALGVERLLLAAATADVRLADIGEISGIEPVDRGPDWARVDSCWVHLPSVRRLVSDATGAEASAVFVDTDDGVGGGDDGMVAYFSAPAELRTPRQAHMACMQLLPERVNAMAPSRYVLCAGALDDPGDQRSWQKLKVIADGTGRA